MDLFAAIAAGDADAVDELVAGDPTLARAKNDRGVSAVLWGLYVGQRDIAVRLAAVTADDPIDVHEAAAIDRVDELGRLLEAEPARVATRSADGFTPLHLAAFFGAPGAVRVLLDHGADVEAVAENEMVVRPLHSAAAGGHGQIVALLLEHGADPNATQQHGFTPLHTAMALDDSSMVSMLIAAGADPSVPKPDPLS
ncbi:MAG: ankyrin repeat domain-containing protein [Acidimicrobiales bacterium]